MIYTKPTNDNIDFLNGLPDIVNVRKRNAKIEENSNLKENYLLKDVYEEIEKLIGGTLHITQMGEVYFTMFHSKTEEESLKFVNLSSSIKNLTMIYFQLKYSETFSTIDENTYYAIDEPEAFLHPMNQIKMARIIAMLVNKGVKVILTTHSDYLIRELNSLVTLGSIDMSDLDKKDLDNFTDVKKDMLLNIKDKSINIYVMDDNGDTNQQEVTEYGFYFESFTNAVDKQNQTINFTHDMVRKNRRDKDDD